MTIPPTEKYSRLSESLYSGLLYIYPLPFRKQYAEEMRLVFRDALREKRHQRAAGLAELWRITLWDVAVTAFKERQELMRQIVRDSVLWVAVGLGLVIAWVDSRPTWDDTGISAGIILLLCAVLGAIRPTRAWLMALAVTLWIPLYAIGLHQNFGSLLAVLIGLIGAYGGVVARRLLQRSHHAH